MKSKMTATMFFALLAFSALACQVLSGIQNRFQDTRQTVEAAATSIDQGRQVLGTAEALTTQIGGQSLIPTAQALATEIGESGLMETAQAIITEQGSGILSTARAIATQEGPAALETVQAYATQFAQTTPAPDIPLIEEGRQALFQSPNLVTYTTSLPFDQVLDFYKSQMPVNGWQVVDQDGFETGSAALLNYEKGTRRASVSLGSAPGASRTLVIITVEP